VRNQIQGVSPLPPDNRGAERDTMVDGPKKNALTREAILRLLSDAEVAKVSGADDAPRDRR
jgi:hypothetical protein